MIIQKIYINALNIIYDSFLIRINKKQREAYAYSIFVGIFVFFLLAFSGEMQGAILYSNSQRQTVMGGMLFLSALFSMTDKLKPVKQNKLIIIPLVLGALGLIATGINHHIGDGYLNFGILLVTVYPCFYIVWHNRKDYATLFDWLAKASVMVNMSYAVYSMALYLAETDRYAEDRFSGTTMNANYFSFIGMLLFCSSIYLIYRNREKLFVMAIYALTALTGFVMSVMGESRAAILIIIGTVVIVGLFWFKNWNPKKASIKRKLIVAMMAVVCVLLLVAMIGGLKGHDTDAHQPTDTSVVERFSPVGKDANTFTSGRITLWNMYIPMLNMTGNDVDKIPWDEMPFTKAAHCHNNFLEFGYRCGMPVAVIFITLELFAGIITLVYLFDKKKKADSYLYPIIILLMYAVCSMIDVATLPVERYAPFLFYLALAMISDPRVQHERLEEKEGDNI